MRRWAGLLLMAMMGVGLAVPKASYGQAEVDKEIRELREKLSQLEQQQIDMRKEATAAAAAMPSFSYRPGNGVSVEAADKAWGLRFTLESHFRYDFESGRDQVGRTQGELYGRRFRPGIFYCLNNCLWEFEASLDLDGWGNGNGKNNAGDDVNSMLQRGAVRFHGENISPWLPTVQFGMEVQNAYGDSLARQGSGAVGAQAEYMLSSRNSGFNTGRAGSGTVLNWDNKSLSAIGIPGRLRRFQFGMSSIAEGDDGTQSKTDRKDFNTYISVQPMSQLKNKWLRGLTFETGAWFCNVDARAAQNGCNRYRLQDHGDGGRQVLFDTGSNTIGKGLHIGTGYGVVWEVGPYRLRLARDFMTSEDGGPAIGRSTTPGKKKADGWLIGHDLFLWSPKGFLTGSPTQAGSVLVGTHFERANMSCENADRCSSINGGEYHRVRVLLREWDLWYFIAPRMSIGTSVLWYDSSNLRRTRNQAAHNLGVCSTNDINSGGCRSGIGGDWIDVFLNWRYTF